MVDWLVVWGVSQVAGFAFKEVLLKLGQGALEDYVKDFFKDCIKDATGGLKKEPLQKAVGKALKEFLQLVQVELEFNGVNELKHYNKALDQFIHDDEVKPILGKAFENGCRSIDAQTLAEIWYRLNLPKLPNDFDWENISKQYLRKVKSLIREDNELRAILDSENLEAIRTSTEEIAGIVPDFNLRQYRESLQEFYGNLKLDVLHASGYEYQVRLWKVFVAQNVREAMPLYDIPKEHLKRLRDNNQLDAEFSLEELERYREVYHQQPIRSVLEVINDAKCHYMVILGDPGSGKSTLAQYLALDWVEKPTKIIPLLIELRKYTRDRNSPKNILEFIHQGAQAICHLNQHQLDEQLKSGNAFVMFDGLDEVFDPVARDAVITEIIRFTNQYPKVRVIVTSRIIGYKPQLLRDAQFRHFTLQDLEPEQIEEFVNKWHDLAFGNHPDKVRLQNRLQAAIDNSPAIRELAGNPLLLTMMAILNRNQELPRDRAELYQQASRVLLHEWDIERGLPADEKLAPDTIGRQEKQAMLRKVAYYMQAAPQGLAGNLISRDDLENTLTAYLETLKEVDKPRTVARLIINQLRERNFILCFFGADSFAFVHRTFLEYFCASEFVWQFEKGRQLSIEQLKTEVFGKHWQDGTWQEVLRLIAAMIGESYVGEIIEYLMEQDGEIAEFRNLFLAAKCLAEVKNRFNIKTTATTLFNRLKQCALSNNNPNVQVSAVRELARGWKDDPDTLAWLKQRAVSDDSLVGFSAMHELALGWKDNPDTLAIFKKLAVSDDDRFMPTSAVKQLAYGGKDDPDTLAILKQLAVSNNSSFVRSGALQELARGWKDDPDTLPILKKLAVFDDDSLVRFNAVQELARGWKDEPGMFELLCNRALKDPFQRKEDSEHNPRLTALEAIVEYYPQHPTTRRLLKHRELHDADDKVKKFATEQIKKLQQSS